MQKTIGLALALLALGGCASVPDVAPARGQQVAATAAAAEDEQPMTGSRLKRKSTDRMLRTVGSQDARDTLDSAPDALKQGQ